jgi:7,8-dihydroneopterin aldolase/epimerase/oxygenase
VTLAGPDRIELRGLRVAAIVGVLPEERDRPQPLEIDLDLIADLSAAGESDDLADTIDYGDIAQVVDAVVTSSGCALLERLAELVARAVLGHARVTAVTVSIRKLRPPVPLLLDTSGVTITRSR